MHVIIHYYIKPVCSRQKFASNAGKSHQPRHLEDKTPEVLDSINQKKAFTHLFLSETDFVLGFPSLFCSVVQLKKCIMSFFLPGLHPQTSKTWEFQEKFPWAKIGSALFLLIGVLRFFNENSFQLCPYNNPRLLMTFLQSTILAGDYWTSQSWIG